MSPDPADVNSYADASPFTRLLETKSRVRILDVFLGKNYEELTRSEISRLAGIDQSSVSRNLGMLLDVGVIERAGREGSAETFTLNEGHPVADALKEVRRSLFDYSDLIDQEDEEERMPVDPQEVSVDSESHDPQQLRESVGSLLEDTDA